MSPNLINLFIRHRIAFQIPLANCCHTWMPLEFVITHNMLQKKPQEHTHQVPTWSTWAGWQQWNWHHNGPRARPEMWLGLDCCWHMSPFIKHRITLGLQLWPFTRSNLAEWNVAGTKLKAVLKETSGHFQVGQSQHLKIETFKCICEWWRCIRQRVWPPSNHIWHRYKWKTLQFT